MLCVCLSAARWISITVRRRRISRWAATAVAGGSRPSRAGRGRGGGGRATPAASRCRRRPRRRPLTWPPATTRCSRHEYRRCYGFSSVVRLFQERALRLGLAGRRCPVMVSPVGVDLAGLWSWSWSCKILLATSPLLHHCIV